MRKLAGIVGVLLWAGMAGAGAKDGVPPVGGAALPASRPAAVTSRVAEKDGLAVTVTLPKVRFAVGEEIGFTIRTKNVSEKAVVLWGGDLSYEWTLAFENTETQEKWVAQPLVSYDYMPANHLLDPGATLETPVEVGAKTHRFVDPNGDRDKGLKWLKAGTYRLTVAHTANKGVEEPQAPYWIGKIASEPVEVVIEDKGAAKQP